MKKRLAMALALLCLLLCGCGFNRHIREAEEKIAAIGTVTADSGPAIEAAETAVDALSAKEREKVKNAAELPKAREEYRRAVAEREERERRERLEALRRELCGKWEFSQDATEIYTMLVDRMMSSMLGFSDLSLADYVDRFELGATFSLLENGTYRIGVGTAQREAFLDSLMGPLGRYFADVMRALVATGLQEEGIYIEDPWSDKAWIAATGQNYEALIAEALGMDWDSYLTYMMQTMREMITASMQDSDMLGNYEVQEGKLLLSESLEQAVSPDAFVSFTLEGDQLTLTGYSNVSSFGSVYPITMKKTP